MTFTLVADGSSDRVLVPIISWMAERVAGESAIGQWADFSRVPRPQNLRNKIEIAHDLYPCDFLFVHRDAEGDPAEHRRTEIYEAFIGLSLAHVSIIPIRMTEAWLFDEQAIRHAAGNPNGRDAVIVPKPSAIERIPDPKSVLRDLIVRASGLNARRRSRLSVQERIQLIPNFIDDYSYLLPLSAFQDLELDFTRAWHGLIER